jgi:parallel beta-helix repeat protein
VKFNRTSEVCRLVLVMAVVLFFSAAVQATTIVVSSSIQAAVDAAKPGDHILVPTGTYKENVLVTKDNLTIQGASDATLDGKGLTGTSGIKVAAASGRISGFTLSGMTIKNYIENGVLLVAVDKFRIVNGTYINNKQYGIFPVQSSQGLVAFNNVSGANDTGIYVGQSKNIEVSGNYAWSNTSGYEVENSSNVKVLHNIAYGNTVGLAVFVLPGLSVPATTNVQVADNLFTNNNRPNPVTDPREPLSLVPSGVGMLIVAADKVTVTRNAIIQNNTVGIAMVRLPDSLSSLDPRVNPLPDQNHFVRNVSMQNATKPDPKYPQYVPVDILWDTNGSGNCWSGNSFTSQFPTSVPGC